MAINIDKKDIYKRLILCYSLSCFAEWILLPIYAIFVQQIWWDILDASRAMAIFLVTSWIMTIVIHHLRRATNHKGVLFIWWWFIWLVWISMYIIVDTTIILFFTQVIIAIGNAMANPIFDEELEENTNTWNKLFKRGLYEGSQDIVNGIAALIGWLIVTFLWFKFMIILMIITATLSFLGIFYYHKVLKYHK